MTNEFELRADYLLAASHCVSAEETRYYLKGVHVEPHPSGTGVIMVATNGHILAALYDPDGYACRKAILTMPWKTSELATKRYEESNRTLYIPSLDAGVGTVKQRCDGDPVAVAMVAEIKDATFPDWRRIVPTDNSKEYAWEGTSFDLGYLTIIAKAIKVIGASGGGNTSLGRMEVIPNKISTGPAMVGHECPNAVFVIMPIRGGTADRAGTRPDWL